MNPYLPLTSEDEERRPFFQSLPLEMRQEIYHNALVIDNKQLLETFPITANIREGVEMLIDRRRLISTAIFDILQRAFPEINRSDQQVLRFFRPDVLYLDWSIMRATLHGVHHSLVGGGAAVVTLMRKLRLHSVVLDMRENTVFSPRYDEVTRFLEELLKKAKEEEIGLDDVICFLRDCADSRHRNDTRVSNWTRWRFEKVASLEEWVERHTLVRRTGVNVKRVITFSEALGATTIFHHEILTYQSVSCEKRRRVNGTI